MKKLLTATLLVACLNLHAETPQQISQHYATQANLEQPGYSPSARRGANFFRQPFAVNEQMPSCTSCHTESPLQPGRHAITGKRIAPMAPAANGERFSDPAKVEKWFGRNCRDVIGRACSAPEKADFIAYLNELRS